ncbi:endonuclease/exonuclease/phosphatase family protein [Pimelobacter simplex]|uniref:endonuclease/exonuclease/phosphatase family protein n=1 Tax=Nocardioides simplex TaxID=2045 RepID=UPI003AAD9273
MTSWRERWQDVRRRLAVLEGVTINDDFTDRSSDVPAILRARRPAWIGIQEGKRDDYADLVQDARYASVQRTTSAATRGVAIVLDRTQVRPVGRHVDDPCRRGHGYRQLTPPGGGIMARGVVWQDVRLVGSGTGRLVRLASVHRHPRRARDRWTEFDAALAAWLLASPLPVWLAGDFNAPVGSLRLPGTTTRRRGIGIDGHVVTVPLRFAGRRNRRLKKRSSDHAGVAALVRVPRRPEESR